ncbi:MAG TPA: UbiA family prenyltransferase [Candidatus Methylacidiphilales bacterium]|nr:UbiA family prenyltransferase [Candidatus Methylacidiphilales bacterium]
MIPRSDSVNPGPIGAGDEAAPRVPLCVDLDGTLLAGDVLYESAVRYVKGNIFRLFYLVVWLLRGRNYLKGRLAQVVEFEPATMPWRQELLAVLQTEKTAGRTIYLITASHGELAERLVRHLALFDGVYGTDSTRNLKGLRKAAFLCEKFGERGYDYIGDSRADYPVWAKAAAGMVVGPPSRVAGAMRANPRVQELKTEQHSLFRSTRRLLRVHQWAKNFIVFVPLIASHRIFETQNVLLTTLAFCSFCTTASATYILNDLLDIEHDRLHHEKRKRPLASGALSIPFAIFASGFLTLLSIAFAAFLPIPFILCLCIYIIFTLAYSFAFKSIILADTILLACLYTIRLLAGHAATFVPLSIWLLAFAVFIFFSLAVAKRFAELKHLALRAKQNHSAPGRDYLVEDMPTLLALGVGSGLISVLVLVLYVQSLTVRQFYTEPLVLLVLVPVYLYWIGRIWILAQRGLLNEDPVLFAITDKVSYGVVFFAFAVMVLAALWK